MNYLSYSINKGKYNQIIDFISIVSISIKSCIHIYYSSHFITIFLLVYNYIMLMKLKNNIYISNNIRIYNILIIIANETLYYQNLI
jgi:hypothetical protein